MKTLRHLITLVLLPTLGMAQFSFDPRIQPTHTSNTVVLPPSPLKYQVIFVGGVDMVQTVDTAGNPNGQALAKEWHDFIGFTEDTSGGDLGWICVNHEMILANDSIGDGGGMTSFKIKRDPTTDTIIIMPQTIADGRSGKFFNVDFVNTVGETGMNCGGIVSTVDGRIWTAEEWFRANNASIYMDGASVGVRDTSDFTINGSGIAVADGQTIKKYQNFNWMVEVDPKQAKAIRKQYNWGRQPFEGGAILPDNKTVFLGADETPGYLSKFVATTAGDFTNGKLYVYREDNQVPGLGHITSIPNLSSEIVAFDTANNYVYSTDAAAGLVHVKKFINNTLTHVRSINTAPYGESPTSVSIYNSTVAIAVVDTVGAKGKIVFVDSTGSLLGTAIAGYHPDMVTFTPDGKYVLVANEGEPKSDYSIDPIGSVSIIDVTGGFASPSVTDADFSSFTLGSLTNVRIYGNGSTDVSKDMEPEYIAVDTDSKYAYVTCQENNAIAVVDIIGGTITQVIGLGYKDYNQSNNAIDASDKDFIDGNFATYPVKGMYQPDAIAATRIGGKTYLITANEGDARDYSAYSEEARVKDFPLDTVIFPNHATLMQDAVLGRLKISTFGADTNSDGYTDIIYSYGARSFSIWDTTGTLIYDSGNDIAKQLLKVRPANFPDDRSDDKGTEPESVTVGVVDGETYAFIGLERSGGIMVYNISNPVAPVFVDYYNNDATDESPEGLAFFHSGGNAYLLVGNEPGDAFNGALSVYRIVGGANAENWIEIDNSNFDNMLNYEAKALEARATMFNRVEWVAYNKTDGNIYFTETGRDDPANKWNDEYYKGGKIAEHHRYRGLQQGVEPTDPAYKDYYGRVLKLDLSNDSVGVFLAGGPEFSAGVPQSLYPNIHLSNPDGLSFMYSSGVTFMIVQEDLNGGTYGRVPDGISNRTCEMFLLDMSIPNPNVNDLMRISIVPLGAEVTGAVATPDGKTILVNSQHPSGSNPYPYNHSLTYAITGWDLLASSIAKPTFEEGKGFQIYPNPTSRELYFNALYDVAIYDAVGKRVKVQRQVNRMDVSDLKPGIYFVRTLDGEMQKLVVQ